MVSAVIDWLSDCLIDWLKDLFRLIIKYLSFLQLRLVVRKASKSKPDPQYWKKDILNHQETISESAAEAKHLASP